MAVSHPERALSRAILLRAAFAGFTLGVTLLTGATVVLSAASGLVAAATGVIATAGLAFVVGLWAGAPTAEWEAPPLPGRWFALGAAVAAAGAVATVLSIIRPVGASSLGRVGTLFLIVALPAYAVALILPALLEWGERSAEEIEEDRDESATWAVLGALAAGLVIGLVLGALLTGLVLLPRSHAGLILIVTSLVPLLAVRLPDPPGPAVQEATLYAGESPFGKLRVAELTYPGERQPERRLYLNGEEESGELVRSGAPVLAYVAAAERWLADATPLGAAYLFLGGGAYTLPRRVAERDATAGVTVVELDPEVTRVAYRFFGLRPELGIRAVHGDARAFLTRAASRWDRIYVDVYAGQESLPYSLVTREAFTEIRALLNEGGMVAMNVIGVGQGAEALRLWSLVRTFEEVFPGAALYSHLGADHPDRQNFLLAGALDREHEFPARAGLFDRWPREGWPGWARTVVFRDLYAPSPQNETPRPPADADREARGEARARPA
jgi:MFS family permease